MCKSVQVERPSSSTSGGQPGLSMSCAGFCDTVVVAGDAFVVDFIILFHAAPEVHVRHLTSVQYMDLHCDMIIDE